MKIDKVINNNIISSFDDQGRELVVMGRGLGFKKKSGQEIDDSLIEKIFRMDNKEGTDHLKTLFSEIPIEHIEITNDIISYAKEHLNKKLNRNIYISLTDHINFAIERHNKGLDYTNPLLWDIKKFYAAEYKVGLEAVQLIKERLNIELKAEDEGAAIALHLVNAELESTMDQTQNITHLIQEVVKIIKYHYQREINEQSIHFERFLTHLKFFAQRIFSDKMLNSNEDGLLEMVKTQYVTAFECTEKIAKFILAEYKYTLSNEEHIYLCIHIQRIMN